MTFGSRACQVSDPSKPVSVLQISAAFQTVFDSGEIHIHPLLTPVLLVPFGERWLFEARGTFESDLAQQPGVAGFHGVVQKEDEYAQLDFIASPYMTVTVGRFLTPFGIFNERLYPVWIRNLASDPLILPIGIGPSNASTGAMIRGGFKVNEHFNVNYALYYSALSTVSALDSSRFAGGRAGIFIPRARLEIGGSYQHSLLQDDHSNLFGFHLVWQPPKLPLDLRAETARYLTQRTNNHLVYRAIGQKPVEARCVLSHAGRNQRAGESPADLKPKSNVTRLDGTI